MTRTIAALLALICFSSCGPAGPENHSFRIYVLSDFAFAEYPDEPFDFDPNTFNLESIELPPEPWISEEMVSEYHWPEHTITLYGAVPLILSDNPAGGTAFLVVADGERCYIGSLWTHLSALRPPLLPIIEYADVEDDNSFRIFWPYSEPDGDEVLSHPKIYESLKALGKLREE